MKPYVDANAYLMSHEVDRYHKLGSLKCKIVATSHKPTRRKRKHVVIMLSLAEISLNIVHMYVIYIL